MFLHRLIHSHRARLPSLQFTERLDPTAMDRVMQVLSYSARLAQDLEQNPAPIGLTPIRRGLDVPTVDRMTAPSQSKVTPMAETLPQRPRRSLVDRARV